MFRWRVTKPGYTTTEVGDASSGVLGVLRFVLPPEGSLPEGMVPVTAGSVIDERRPIDPVALDDFFIDRVRSHQSRVQEIPRRGRLPQPGAAGPQPFVKDGRTVAWDDAMAEFRDATGRPGPATWELGAYPDGQDDFPVRGVSWFEAAAYAKFAGKSICRPSITGARAASRGVSIPIILASSNFDPTKARRVSASTRPRYPYGTFDMAGNVKEWCSTAARRGPLHPRRRAGTNRSTCSAATDARSPFDRAATNGVRTIKMVDPAAVPALAFEPVPRLFRDYAAEKPIDDDTFRTYRSLYAYDPTPLAPVVESADDTNRDWRVERITYAAAYDGERITAYLFLPKQGARPPYQTVVYFPHSGGTVLRDFEQVEMSYLGFIVKSGHALLLPMYKGYYERRLAAPPSGPNAYRDLTIKQVKDVRQSVDYLMTRPDVDHDRLAYFGVSSGATIAPMVLSMEPRFKIAVLWSGGLPITRRLPEVDPMNFAPRVTIPVLMLNGRDDFSFPIEASQRPMLRLFGTADADKKHVLYDGGHVFPFARVQKDSLDWLDRYLGVPK